jgi:hypothetical protein
MNTRNAIALAAQQSEAMFVRRSAVGAMSGRRIDSARLQTTDDLLGRIMSVLDSARGQVVRAVNHVTVSAYWHIGREVVEALQQGGERAAYGKALIERLAQQLTDRYGRGFSATNLGYFRQFYLAYRDRIPHPLSGESQPKPDPGAISHPAGGELLPTFHPNLSWSHYRALMRVLDSGNDNYQSAKPAEVALVTSRLAAGAAELRDEIVDAWRQSKSITVGFPLVSVADILAGRVMVTPQTFGAD